MGLFSLFWFFYVASSAAFSFFFYNNIYSIKKVLHKKCIGNERYRKLKLPRGEQAQKRRYLLNAFSYEFVNLSHKQDIIE